MRATDATIRPITTDALPAVLALNNMHAQALSWLDPPRLAKLVARSFHARQIGARQINQVRAFVLASDEAADYDSVNFLWFRARYDRFVYVDRIVVDAALRGRGYARCLYEDLIARATDAGHVRIVCEINSAPPNPISDAFHAALGFSTVGSATIHGGAKTVRYLVRPLPLKNV